MKDKIFNILIIIVSLFVTLELFVKKNLIYNSIMYALNMWLNNLIPALFPFFIISDILINYNITDYIPKIIKNFCKYVFNITDNMLTILILSMISGFPSNARNTRSLYDMGMISLDEANHILIFSHFANPIFILTTVSVFFLNNERLGIIILISHYLSNFVLGIFFKNKFVHVNSIKNMVTFNNNFGNIFINAIKKGIDTILMICGIVVIFLVMASLVVNIFNFNSYNEMLVKGFFEITIGIEKLSKLNLSDCYKVVITSIFLAFGGISVHMQVICQTANSKIQYVYFLIGRIYQMILSGIISYILYKIFNI